MPEPRKYTYTGNDRILKQLVLDEKPISHHIPRGERSKWSKAQYTVYKEEKRATRKKRWAIRKPTLDAIAKHINERVNATYQFIEDRKRSRTLLGKVSGRKAGQPAVEKDEKGFPIVEKPKIEVDQSDDDSEGEEEAIYEGNQRAGNSGTTPKQSKSVKNNSVKAKQPVSKGSGDESRGQKRAHVTDSEHSEEELAPPVKKGVRTTGKSIKAQPKRKSIKAWVAPESSDDDSTNELDYMRGKGLTIIHDHWPSPWRVMAAAMVNTDRINKSVNPVYGPLLTTQNALKKFKVTEAQLLTLTHHLVVGLVSILVDMSPLTI